jgi:four helix bundle protein
MRMRQARITPCDHATAHGEFHVRTQHFRNLLVWQGAMQLARRVYEETQGFPKDETFGLRNQIRRAAVSVPSNIAEGHGRVTDQAFGSFLAHARGSLYEVETRVQLSADLRYLSTQTASELIAECAEIGRLLNGLLRKLRKSPPKTS